MHIVPEHLIDVPADRMRKVFDETELAKLQQSIYMLGLLHPPVVIPEGERYTLIAGERRLRAMRALIGDDLPIRFNREELPEGHVAVVFVEDLGEIKRKEMELEENLRREDLSWAEQAKAIADLHALRRAENPEQTKKDTAEELAEITQNSPAHEQKRLKEALILTPHMDNPEIAQAPDHKTAVRRVEALLRQEFEGEIARRAGAKRKGQEGAHLQLVQGDCTEILPTLETGRFSMILTDPPYGMNAGDFGNAAHNAHKYSDDAATASEVASLIIREGYRLCREQAALFMFCDIDLFVHLREVAQQAGWKTWRTPLIWNKYGGGGHAPWQNAGPRRRYEIILYAAKGSRNWKAMQEDIITCQPETKVEYAAKKPADLFKAFIDNYALPGEEILDPCCGAGTIFEACQSGTTRALGIELDDHGHKLATIALERSLSAREKLLGDWS